MCNKNRTTEKTRCRYCSQVVDRPCRAEEDSHDCPYGQERLKSDTDQEKKLPPGASLDEVIAFEKERSKQKRHSSEPSSGAHVFGTKSTGFLKGI